jgi:hypothetical protein
MPVGQIEKKEDLARKIAERDAIGDGLVCVFFILESYRTFSVPHSEIGQGKGGRSRPGGR